MSAFRAASPAGLTLIQLRPLGGAIADPAGTSGGVVGHLESDFLAFAGGILAGPEHRVDREQVFRPVRAAVDGLTVPRTVPSLLSGGQDLPDAYPADTLRRLAGIKARVDPEGLIRSNRRLTR